MRASSGVIAACWASLLAGCGNDLAVTAEGLRPPVMNPVTEMNRSLRALPPPERRLAVAVYGYTDQTGQFKPADNVQSLSRAVTQGATSVLIKALQDAGDGAWFTVVEREKLDNLLKERRIIADMRERYLGERNLNPKALPPLLFAGVLLEGGIIGYDSDTRTGGAGARYLGIGGDVKYREDTVTIYLRAISTKTGEVLVSVVSHKVVVSVGVQGGAFKFVALDKILEAEAGITRNEPEQLAVQQAVEKAVYAMIVEGAARGLWAFSDKVFQAEIISKFQSELSTRPVETAARDEDKRGQGWALASGRAPSEVRPAARAPDDSRPSGRAPADTRQTEPSGETKTNTSAPPSGPAPVFRERRLAQGEPTADHVAQQGEVARMTVAQEVGERAEAVPAEFSRSLDSPPAADGAWSISIDMDASWAPAEAAGGNYGQ
jgi:curli production assembly/transport component CsgG